MARRAVALSAQRVIHFDQVRDRARLCGADPFSLAGGIALVTWMAPEGLRTSRVAPDLGGRGTAHPSGRATSGGT
jgi:hypothetical protein